MKREETLNSVRTERGSELSLHPSQNSAIKFLKERLEKKKKATCLWIYNPAISSHKLWRETA